MSSEETNPEKPQKESKKKSKIDLSVSPQGFAELVTGMSRFLNHLSETSAFRDSNLDLNEWTLLTSLNKEARRSKKLGKEFGVSKERGRQLIERLKGKGYVTVAGDKGVTTVTEEGRNRLETIAGNFETILNQFKQKQGAFQKISKNLRTLNRALSEPDSAEKKARKGEKKKKRRAEETSKETES